MQVKGIVLGVAPRGFRGTYGAAVLAAWDPGRSRVYGRRKPERRHVVAERYG